MKHLAGIFVAPLLRSAQMAAQNRTSERVLDLLETVDIEDGGK